MRYSSCFTLLIFIIAGCNSNEDLPGSRPVADAGNSIEVSICEGTVLLDGSASSDPDGDSLSYEWTIVDVPVGNDQPRLNNSMEPIASITPNAVGTYIIRLSVSDGIHPAVTDEVTITVDVSTNDAPTADPGDDRTVPVGKEVILDASNSTDPDDDELTYQWSISGKPVSSQATITNADQMQAQFTPDVSGRYVFNLRVADGSDACSEDNSATLIITAE